jgi:hypothetical protein
MSWFHIVKVKVTNDRIPKHLRNELKFSKFLRLEPEIIKRLLNRDESVERLDRPLGRTRDLNFLEGQAYLPDSFNDRWAIALRWPRKGVFFIVNPSCLLVKELT